MKKTNTFGLIRLCRPKHWIKNILVFAPLVFSGKLLNPVDFLITVAGWFAFGFIASAVYVFNDLCDLENDRRHEIKKNRPLASGIVSPRAAIVLSCFLLICAFTVNAVFCPATKAICMLALYIVLNIVYSVRAKKVPLLDIAILVSGFLIRIYYGAFLIDTPVSPWLYLTITAMAAYLGLGKRRNELKTRIRENQEIDGVLKSYPAHFLDRNMYMCLTLAITFYALWSISPVPVLPDEATDYRIGTVPLVLLICMRYSLLIEIKTYADPVDVLTSDKALISLVLLYGAYMLFLMYGSFFF